MQFAWPVFLRHESYTGTSPMDKKTKKRLEVLRKRLDKTRTILAAAKQQTDEPDEVEKIEAQISELQNEIAELKKG